MKVINNKINDENENIKNIDELNKEINNDIKKNSNLVIKAKEQIYAIDNTEKEAINNGFSEQNNLNPNMLKKDIYETKKENNNFSITDKSNKIMNNLLIKNKNRSLVNKKKYILSKNSSYISLLQNSQRKDNFQNLNHLSKFEENKTKNDYINIKKIYTNSKNTLSRMTNLSNNIEKNNKFALLKSRQNKLNSMIKVNSHISNVFNINKNDIHNMHNNSSNINIYLSINMFNKMLNNHYNKNKKINYERNIIQDLLNKQKQLIINENKKKLLDNYMNQGNKKKYYIKSNNKPNVNKIYRNNSVGLLLNNNMLNFRNIKNNNNKYNINKLYI